MKKYKTQDSRLLRHPRNLQNNSKVAPKDLSILVAPILCISNGVLRSEVKELSNSLSKSERNGSLFRSFNEIL